MVSTDWSVPDRKLLVTVTGFGIAYLVLLFLGLEWKYNRGLDVISREGDLPYLAVNCLAILLSCLV